MLCVSNASNLSPLGSRERWLVVQHSLLKHYLSKPQYAMGFGFIFFVASFLLLLGYEYREERGKFTVVVWHDNYDDWRYEVRYWVAVMALLYMCLHKGALRTHRRDLQLALRCSHLSTFVFFHWSFVLFREYFRLKAALTRLRQPSFRQQGDER